MKPPDMLPRFGGPVLRHVLRQGEHQRLAVVQHIYLLPLRLRKAECAPYRADGYERAGRHKDNSEQAYLSEGCLDVL